MRTGDSDGPATKPQAAKEYERLHGIPVSIETPKGGVRSGKGWSVTLPAHYGFIDGTVGADGDGIDVYLGPDLDSDTAYIVDQLTLDGKRFDEAKVMLAFPSEEAALTAYMAGHHASGDTFGAITRFTVPSFKQWLETADLTKPVAGSAYMAGDADFEEGEHPRENDGKFGSKGGGVRAQRGPGKKESASKSMPAAPSNREEWPEHIKSLKLPPAWKNVHISANPDSPLQATGVDAVGRTQRVYSKKFADSQSIIKFKRGDKLVKDAPTIIKQLAAGRASDDPKTVSHADCASLIMAMGIRPGSDADTGAKVKAYGASTLLGQHVVVDGDKVRLQFTAKKGVKIDMPVDDKAIATMLRDRANAAGADGKLFGPVTGSSLLTYVHKSLDTGKYKTKDFRTLLANHVASTEVAKWAVPTTLKEYKKSVLAVAKAVAERLGNTPAVAIRSYISPTIFAPWKGDLA
jgi:DNA topoisomerase IB